MLTIQMTLPSYLTLPMELLNYYTAWKKLVNAKKTKFMQQNSNGNIETTSKLPLELVDFFTYLGSNIESPEN